MKGSPRIWGALFALFLVAGALLPWWHLAGVDEPKWFTLPRILIFLMGTCTLLVTSAFGSVRLASRFAFGAMLVPPLAFLTLAVYDPANMSLAVNQVNQVSRLISDLTTQDVMPSMPWLYQRRLMSSNVVRNDYGLLDAMECSSFFAKEGMYLTLAGAVLLWLWALRYGGSIALPSLRERRFLFAGGLMVACVYFVPMGTAHCLWHLARFRQANGESAGAIALLKISATLDRRLDYDFAYHFDLGRLYSEMGKTNEPDYWATIADIYAASDRIDPSQADQAYLNYVVGLPQTQPTSNPTQRYRMANVCLRKGQACSALNDDATALHLWRKGLELEPTNIQLQWSVATTEARQGNYRSAILAWTKIAKDNESVGLSRSRIFVSFIYRKMLTARAWSNLAWCYYKLGDYRNAEASKHNAEQSGSFYRPIKDEQH